MIIHLLADNPIVEVSGFSSSVDLAVSHDPIFNKLYKIATSCKIDQNFSRTIAVYLLNISIISHSVDMKVGQIELLVLREELINLSFSLTSLSELFPCFKLIFFAEITFVTDLFDFSYFNSLNFRLSDVSESVSGSVYGFCHKSWPSNHHSIILSLKEFS